MKLNYLLVIIIFLWTTTSCRKNKAGTEKINDKVNAYMSPASEKYGNKQPFSIACRTEERYPCSNYSIIYNMSSSGNTFDIELEHVKTQEICLTAIGPATCTVPIGDVEDGNYNLNFFLNGRKNSYQLTVTDKSYSISGNSSTVAENQKYVDITEKILMKIPADIYWGKMWDHTGDNMQPAYRWLDSALSSKGAVATKLEAGNYFYFKVDKSGVPVSDDGSKSINYVYKYTGAIDDLKPIFKHFADTVSVRLQNADDKLLTN